LTILLTSALIGWSSIFEATPVIGAETEGCTYKAARQLIAFIAAPVDLKIKKNKKIKE
jgi:hypothetical protein